MDGLRVMSEAWVEKARVFGEGRSLELSSIDIENKGKHKISSG